MPQQLSRQYWALKRLAVKDLRAEAVADAIAEMAYRSRQLLAACERLDFQSRVQGKEYFGFRGEVESRPINSALYVHADRTFDPGVRAFVRGELVKAEPALISRITYTLANSVFAAHDTNLVGRKASATFFEILIGHIIARTLNVSPRRKVRVPESQAELPTDYVFDLGIDSRKLHLPIKTSTRERAVQAWVHQLVLDRIFGNGVYRGGLVVGGETKRASKTGEVIEICVPRQLQMFQSRVAEMSRVYYLDPPQAYLALSISFPRIEIKSFGEAPADIIDLLHN